MAFKKVGGGRKYFKYAECQAGQVLVAKGKYLGAEQGKFGIQHVFQDLNGDGEIVLNSSGHLNYLLDKYAVIGTICMVEYTGKVELEKGKFAGKECHNFELYTDDESGVTVKVAAAEKAEVEELMANASFEDISL